MDADTVIVGAGPGGASAAFHLARRGRRVLLIERQRFPRDKSCGDGLTRFTARLLHEMGVLDLLAPSQRAMGVRVLMRGQGRRDFAYPADRAEPSHGLIVPRLVLDEIICRQAVEAGAGLIEEATASRLVYEDGAVAGVEIVKAGERRVLRAPVVVAADGAASRLAYQAGLVGTPPDRLGFGIRGYYEGIEELSDLLEIYMPLLDPSDRYLLPSYGWVFPTGPGTANVGVGIVDRERGVNVRELYTRFVETLQREDPRFRHAHACGALRGAPLRFDFVPERCAAPGLLLVGDAAGMISPFTGEGIGYAIESGKLAAETIDRSLDGEVCADLSDYAALLARKYTGYFEAGRESARRYRLVWHVLASTFGNEKPLFDICRKAALFPEGIGESYASEVLEDVSALIVSEGPSIRADLVSIGEVLIEVTRRDWPFLARLLTADQTSPGIPFRPALFLLLAGRIATARRALLVQIGTAIELGYLAMLAQSSVGEESEGGSGIGLATSSQPGVARTGFGETESRSGEAFSGPSPPRGSHLRDPANGAVRTANWGNMFALVVSDFLLSKAYSFSAQVATEVSREIASALSRACEGHVQALRNAYNPDLAVGEYLDVVSKKGATLFELPCRLGGRLSGASVPQTTALATYGRHLGLAFQLADDVRILSGRGSSLARATGSSLPDGVYGLPILHVLHSGARDGMRAMLEDVRAGRVPPDAVSRFVASEGGVDATFEHAGEQIALAKRALEKLPVGPTRISLAGLADYVLSRDANGAGGPGGRSG